MGSRKHYLRPQHLPCQTAISLHLYVDENKGIAKEALTQTLSLEEASGLLRNWTLLHEGGQLTYVTAAALLVKSTVKITMRQEHRLYNYPSCHQGSTQPPSILQPPDHWISNAWLVHYQSLLLNLPLIKYHPPPP